MACANLSLHPQGFQMYAEQVRKRSVDGATRRRPVAPSGVSGDQHAPLCALCGRRSVFQGNVLVVCCEVREGPE